MECKVKTSFYDRYTGRFHGVGTVYSCSKERFAEIQNQGDFLIKPEERPAKKRPKN